MKGAGNSRPLLVTGGAGFLGSALCLRLVAAGRRVVVYDNLSRGRREFLPEAVSLIEGDIRDRDRWQDAVASVDPDCVVHLAAMHFIPDCIAHPEETLDVNVAGTRSVLDGCRRGGSLRHVVLASSAAVYAPAESACTEETTPIGPVEIYGESKVAAERLAEAFHRDTGTPTTVLRLFNAVGRRETNPHVIPHIFESLRTSDVIPLGSLAARRDYVDSRDVADAVLAVLAGTPRFDVLNVGTGVASSVADVIAMLRVILGRPIAAAQEPSRLRASERALLLADTRRMQEATGWSSRIGLQDALEDLSVAYGLSTGASLRRASQAQAASTPTP